MTDTQKKLRDGIMKLVADKDDTTKTVIDALLGCMCEPKNMTNTAVWVLEIDTAYDADLEAVSYVFDSYEAALAAFNFHKEDFYANDDLAERPSDEVTIEDEDDMFSAYEEGAYCENHYDLRLRKTYMNYYPGKK